MLIKNAKNWFYLKNHLDSLFYTNLQSKNKRKEEKRKLREANFIKKQRTPSLYDLCDCCHTNSKNINLKMDEMFVSIKNYK